MLPYSDYAGIVGLVILVFAVVVTPELLCPDRRDGTLALYFATAVSRTDYVVGKVLAALLPLLLVTVLPPAILYAGNVLFATHPLGYVQEHTARHPPDRRRWHRHGAVTSHSSALRSRRSPAAGPSRSAATWHS